MADTSVHYNSSAPARIGTLAYAAGNQIHLGPGRNSTCHGFLQNEIDHITPGDIQHAKYFMPFMLRNGLMPFYESMTKAERALILKLEFKSDGESKTPVKSIMSALAEKKDYFVEKGVQGHGQISTSNLI
jgi:hypothetical protein